MDEEYLKILQMIQDGALSAAEGAELLDALEGQAEFVEEVPVESLTGASAQMQEEPSASDWAAAAPELPPGPPATWRRIWIYPLIGGVALLLLAALLTADLVQGGGRLGWLACTVPLMTFGTVVAILAWWSRSARWLHILVRDPKKKKFRLSLPLPLHLAAWVLRFLSPWVPALQETAVDELILSLAEVDLPGTLLAVEVNDEEEGEEVRVYVG